VFFFVLFVQCYGGGLWHTWFDRDLSISGKVVLRHQTPKMNNGDNETPTKTTFSHKLVQLTEPVARVSTLCIHLQSDTERKAFAVNKEDHTAPIVASTSTSAGASSSSLLLEPNKALEDGAALQLGVAAVDDPWSKGQEPLLLKKIAEKLGVEANQIADWDLSLYDAQGMVKNE
jgi:aspartyl aminopeptidase